jgi:hypothetical protein
VTADEPEVGSVGEEAAKLVNALSDWAKDQGGGAATGLGGSIAGLADLARDIESHVGGENCTYCPLCRLIGLVRGASPEVRGHLTTATTALLQAGLSALATPVPDTSQQRRSGLQQIDLEDGDWDREEDPDR